MLRRRFLVPFAALLAMAAAAPVFFGGGSQAQEADVVAIANPAPSASAELRVWQSVRSPLRLWVSSRPDAGDAWSTSELNLAMIEGGGWRIASRTVDALDGEIELRVWQHPGRLSLVYLSARPGAGGSWDEYGTQRLRLDETSRSGRYRYGDASVALEWPDADAPEPGSDAVTLCPPEGLDTETLSARVWRSVATPRRYYISSRPDTDARWTIQRLTLAETGEDGWSAASLTVDAGDADFELRLWARGNAVALSARVAGTTWDEYGARSVTLNRTSRSGNYTYANRTVRLTLPEAEPPRPGASARTWDCPETTPDTGTGEPEATPTPTPDPENRAPWADAGDDQTVSVGDTVQLDGSDSADIDEDDLTYTWTQDTTTTDPDYYTTAITLTDPATATPSFEVPAEASGKKIAFTLTVTDEHGLTKTDAVTITVLQQQQGGGGGAPPGGGGPPSTSPGTQDPNNEAPTAHAGPDQHAAPGDTVTLDGNGSTDPEQGDLTYSWAMTSDGTYDGGDSISPGATVNPEFTMPSNADIGETLIFKLTVRDTGGKTDTDTVTITTNTPPTVDAGTDQTVLRDATVNLSGAVTESDPNQTMTYQWRKTGGTYTGTIDITITTTTPPTASFKMPKAAKHNQTVILTLTATDSLGGKGSDTVTITAQNRAPDGANAGDDDDAVRGSTVTLVQCPASATDPDGDDLTCSWEKTGGTYTGNIDITTTTPPTFTMPTDAATNATVTLTLTVSDGYGGSDTDDVTYTATNATPMANAGANQDSAARGSTVTLDGSRSADSDGTISSYSWERPTGPAGGTYNGTITLTGATTASPSFTLPADAELGDTVIIRLTVTDNESATATDTVTITAALVNAGTDADVQRGSTASLDGTYSDPDGTTRPTYNWTKTGGTYTGRVSITDSDKEDASFTVPTAAAADATIILTLTVTDGGSTFSDTVTITAKNVSPTANAGNDQLLATRGSTITLSGSGSDTDGTISSYSWDKTGGTYDGDTTITIANSDKANASFTLPADADPADTLIFTLTVTDNDDATDTNTVTIKAANVAPTANAGADRNVTAGNTASLSVTANDPDGSNSAMTYSWDVSGTPTATLTGATTATPGLVVPSSAWNASPHYTYTATVTVTDEDGATATDSATLTVNNRAPVAVARTDKAYALHPQKVNLNALSSKDPDYDPNTDPFPNWSYSWAKTGGTYSGNIAITADAFGSASFQVPNEASIGDTIIITLTLGDGDGGTDTDSVTINVNAPPQQSNKPPIANAGAAIQYFSLTPVNKDNPTVSLDGSGSSDPDGDTLYYSWKQYGGTCKATITLTNPASAKPTFQWPGGCAISTSIGLRLTVTDRAKNGLSDTEDVQVWRRNGMPTVTINNGAAVTAWKHSDTSQMSSATVTAVISDDPDGHTLTYEWLVQKDGWSGTKPCPPPNQSKQCVDPPPGISVSGTTTKKLTMTLANAAATGSDYTVNLIVRDSQGSTLTKSAGLTIANNTAPGTPTLSPTSLSGILGQAYGLRASATDSDSGQTLSYEWILPANCTTYLTLSSTNTDTTNLTIKPSTPLNTTCNVKAKVTDGYGGESEETLIVTVRAP